MTEPHVALIGPVLPFRGGIAQHTTMLHRALRETADVRTVSFTRQYPPWLFPGKSDRDPQCEGHVEPGVEYLIDSLNPRTWRAALQRCLAHEPEAVIIPWWTVYWAPCFRYLAGALRRADIDVIFLCHNVVEHESAWWKNRLTLSVLRQGTHHVVHSREGGRHLKSAISTAHVSFYPHPIYDRFPAAEGSLARRSPLELLFFGFVRPYKGLDLLLEAMADLKDTDVRLTVVGEFWEGHEQIERQIHELGLEDRVDLVARYVDDAEAAEYFDRADAVVLPYRSATGTGIIPLAYHYEKPVLVTDVGGLPDVVSDGETGLIVEPNSPGSLATAVRQLDQTDLTAMKTAIRQYKQQMTWRGLAEHVLSTITNPEVEDWRPTKPR